MNNQTEFEQAVALSIRKNVGNDYKDNLLEERHKKLKRIIKKQLVSYSVRAAYFIGVSFLMRKKERTLIKSFQYLYERLNDQYSKALLIQVLTYRLLGYRKVKLPMNDGHYLENIQKVEKSIVDKEAYINSNINQKFYLHDLNKYGYFAKIYIPALSIFYQFIQKAYEYNALNIRVKRGDVVIDAGACYGETAIYFAQSVGPDGKVYCFEFSKPNLDILYKNLNLNLNYNKRINVIEKPLWSQSDIDVGSNNGGPGNQVILASKPNDIKVKTISLDDFDHLSNLKRIDFIKMDIEGAELEALMGAKNVLKKYKPILAISVYHKVTDCYKIPKYINSQNLGYKFHFAHYSVHNEESVLFAKV
ncbi:MAG: FkbM family methyltransferase [Candidatus Rickettsiella isopodorum]|nr:FkbM family methyltransferase [Candidatus Rickettsiella isopodorum]MDD5342159.1 FkbM family methyltransferase [Patescibacteria group bacterium]